MKKAIKPVVFSLFMIMILTAFSGCILRPSPAEPKGSLQELVDSIDKSLNIYFPDTSRYVFLDGGPFDKVYKGKSNILQGYNYGGDLDTSQSDTGLSSLYILCNILKVAYDERNPVPILDANSKVLGINVYESITDQSKNPDYLASGRYKEGSMIMSYYYQFDLKECRYSISAHLVISPEELNDMDTEAVAVKVEGCKSEVLDLVKSIMTQG